MVHGGFQALWRTLRNPADSISHVAYRVLGKFGGSNRKMLKESQKLHYVVTEVQGPSITVEFSDCKASLQLPMEKVSVGRLGVSSGCCPFQLKTGSFCVKVWN